MSRKIVSLTLTRDSEAVIGDCIRSVGDVVDIVWIVDTGSKDKTIDVARETVASLHLRAWDEALAQAPAILVSEISWPDSFGAARNLALDLVRTAYPDAIVLVLDSDERLVKSSTAAKPRESILRWADGAADVGLVRRGGEGEGYLEHLVRLPSLMYYVGPTHEARVGGERSICSGFFVDELPKDRETVNRNAERNVLMLDRFLTENAGFAKDSRWRFYLGMAHMILADAYDSATRWAQAESCLVAASLSSGFYEERAWASYQAAVAAVRLGRLHAAHGHLLRAASIYETPEVYAYLAWVALRIGRPTAYVRSMLDISQSVECPNRIGFRDPAMLRQLPALRTDLLGDPTP
jgi:glycosyltransferase involved in cell wall biosynthesis